MTAPEPSTLVFGATGALGRHLLQALVERETSAGSITAAGRNRARLSELAAAGFATAAVDLSDPHGVAELVARHPRVVLISGDTDFTCADIASAMSVVLERDVTHRPVTPDELRTSLTRSGLDPGLADFLVGLDETIAAGTFSRVGDDLHRLVGRSTTGLVEGLSEEHR